MGVMRVMGGVMVYGRQWWDADGLRHRIGTRSGVQEAAEVLVLRLGGWRIEGPRRRIW